MRNIQILGQDFEVLDVLENINIADSFVLLQNKIGNGNGEAKLYIGYRNDFLDNFFGERGFSCDCFLLKEDLINYVEEIRKEHFAPTQEYRQINIFEEKWEEKMHRVLSLENYISFQIKDQDSLKGPRLYVNSDSIGYKLIRELALPIISHINITKLRNRDTNEIKYYFYLFSDYTNDIVEEQEISIGDDEFEPFNPDQISIDTKKITMDTLIRRLKQGTINLNPDFQRNYVWTLEKKCQLIESLMLNIPLPMFYVSADEDGDYSVVDGLQRLTTIKEFIIDNKFKLKKLEFWSEQFDNYSFEELPVYIQNRILETEFTFTVINSGTPEVVKRNIFKRVNRGGAPLTEQEIRHALYSGESTKLLNKLASCKEFLKATNSSIKSERMLDREFILRLLSFMLRKYSSYPKNGNMDTFLSDTLKIINVIPNIYSKELNKINGNLDEDIKVLNIDELRDKFITGMIRSSIIFGEHAFRKSYKNRRKGPINKALFEVWGVLLGEMGEDRFDLLMKNKEEFLNEYEKTFLQDYNFNNIISRNALKYSSVQERYTKLSELLNKYIAYDREFNLKIL